MSRLEPDMVVKTPGFFGSVLEHFQDPRNRGSLPDFNRVGHAGTTGQHGRVTIYLRVEDGVVNDARHESHGCRYTSACGSHTVGWKRNMLMARASGRFVVFVDDDDEVDNEYLRTICEAIETSPEIDCIGYMGEMTWAGEHPEPTIYSLKYREAENREVAPGHNVYLRPPQHVNPMRRDVAVQFPFPDQSFGEDFIRSQELVRRQVLRKECFVGYRVMYRYQFDSQKTETRGDLRSQPVIAFGNGQRFNQANNVLETGRNW